MKDCHLVEDLWPLYEEDLVQPDTKKWIEAHVQQCERCQQLLDGDMHIMDVPEHTLQADRTIASATIKLHVYQLLLVILSFIFAMNTSIFANQGFQFILSYFILGVVVYYFYKNWLLTIAIAFIPTVILNFYDMVTYYGSVSEWLQSVQDSYQSLWMVVLENIVVGVINSGIHTIFTVVGVIFVLLIQMAFKKEEKA